MKVDIENILHIVLEINKTRSEKKKSAILEKYKDSLNDKELEFLKGIPINQYTETEKTKNKHINNTYFTNLKLKTYNLREFKQQIEKESKENNNNFLDDKNVKSVLKGKQLVFLPKYGPTKKQFKKEKLTISLLEEFKKEFELVFDSTDYGQSLQLLAMLGIQYLKNNNLIVSADYISTNNDYKSRLIGKGVEFLNLEKEDKK